MAPIARHVYVISDLHLGGVYELPDDPSGRGFRICTHVPEVTAFVDALAAKPSVPSPVELVINGDLVDFLAEREPDGPGWVPFTPDPRRAVAKLDDIVERDRPFFDALGRLLERGHGLRLLLGNHDIELSLPRVRQRLETLIGITRTHDYRFIYDGEAYVVGNVLIEHGNRYDPWNVVDHDALRRVRSLLSRNQPVPSEYGFEAPPGSRMVADVVNPIKSDYRFIDLLKPETGAAIPILLALEPGYRRILAAVARHGLSARSHRMQEAALPSMGGDIAAGAARATVPLGGDISAPGPLPARRDALEDLLRETLGDEADAFTRELAETVPSEDPLGGDIAAFEAVNRAIGWASLLTARRDDLLGRRLPALLKAVRVIQDDRSFDRDVETVSGYADAARDLVKGGHDYIVFGHTHLAKKVALGNGACYLNSGTWADLIRFPTEILVGPEPMALQTLAAFVDDLSRGTLAGWVSFRPTYVRLDLDGQDRVVAADIHDYEETQDV